jgi:hypothetical protein
LGHANPQDNFSFGSRRDCLSMAAGSEDSDAEETERSFQRLILGTHL